MCMINRKKAFWNNILNLKKRLWSARGGQFKNLYYAIFHFFARDFTPFDC